MKSSTSAKSNSSIKELWEALPSVLKLSFHFLLFSILTSLHPKRKFQFLNVLDILCAKILDLICWKHFGGAMKIRFSQAWDLYRKIVSGIVQENIFPRKYIYRAENPRCYLNVFQQQCNDNYFATGRNWVPH